MDSLLWLRVSILKFKIHPKIAWVSNQVVLSVIKRISCREATFCRWIWFKVAQPIYASIHSFETYYVYVHIHIYYIHTYICTCIHIYLYMIVDIPKWSLIIINLQAFAHKFLSCRKCSVWKRNWSRAHKNNWADMQLFR